MSLICAGMLPPSFVEYALRGGADGVMVVGCREEVASIVWATDGLRSVSLAKGTSSPQRTRRPAMLGAWIKS